MSLPCFTFFRCNIYRGVTNREDTHSVISVHNRFSGAFDSEKRLFASSYPSVCLYQGKRYLKIFREISFVIFTKILSFLLIFSQPETING